MPAVPPSALPASPRISLGPGEHLAAITPSDTTTYSPPLRGLWVGGAGNVAVLAVGDTAPQTITGVPVGTFINWILVSKVMATNTTATLILGVS